VGPIDVQKNLVHIRKIDQHDMSLSLGEGMLTTIPSPSGELAAASVSYSRIISDNHIGSRISPLITSGKPQQRIRYWPHYVIWIPRYPYKLQCNANSNRNNARYLRIDDCSVFL